LAHLSRLSGDFPQVLETAQVLGWEGRHQRMLGDVWWVQGEMERAAVAYRADRGEAGRHGAAGEAAMAQASIAFAIAFVDPARADDEIEMADRLLAGVNLRSAVITARIAALVRDAGYAGDLQDRAAVLLAEISVSGLAYTAAKIQLVMCFHHVVLDAHDELAAGISRLRDLTQSGNYAHYVEIAHFMAGLPLREHAPRARWIDGQQRTRERWRAVVNARRDYAGSAS
jgi:hypothetical protein